VLSLPALSGFLSLIGDAQAPTAFGERLDQACEAMEAPAASLPPEETEPHRIPVV
jgi:hypothetical protein